MSTSIADVLRAAWRDFLGGLEAFLPHLLAMLSLVAVGFLIAWVLAFVIRHALRWLKLDTLADRVGAAAVLRKVSLPGASDVVASMVFWVVWATFVLAGLSALGFPGIENIAAEFVVFLPRLLVGVVVVVVGLIAANFAWRATLLAAVNANLRSARLLSSGVRWLIVALAIAMALEQVGVAKTIMLVAFAIAFGALMIGVAIAIGIGGAPVARRLIERQFPESRKEDESHPDDLKHL